LINLKHIIARFTLLPIYGMIPIQQLELT